MESDEFKAPIAPASKPAELEKHEADHPQKVSSMSPAEKAYKEKNYPPLNYKEPTWSGSPPSEGNSYYLEEIKSGTIVTTHKLFGKSYFVVGRLPVCDIQLEHPSLSRYHAILQYRSEPTEEEPVGFYLYDLDSTHGTFHNKHRCFPSKYYRLRVGHALKFGLSTRLLIVQGPSSDMEEESELSVTELKALAAVRAKKKAEEEDQKRAKEEMAQGVSWGIDNDEDEDEEMPDMEKNPFAVTGTDNNEKLYASDPKKFLKAWFEREGYDDLDFVCTEKGFATFHVKIDLPIDVMGTGETVVVAEVNHRGKKKDAINECAMEACRLLDKYGAIGSAGNHESAEIKRNRKWEENDYYSSSDDEYLDRTKAIQEKRQKRMKMASKSGQAGAESQQVETFESLNKKHSDLSKEISDIEDQLKAEHRALENAKSLSKQESDDVDAYIQELSKTGKGESAAKENISKLKQKLATLRQELTKIDRLRDIARPVKMPELKKVGLAAEEAGSVSKAAKFSGIMVGKRKGGLPSTMRTIQPTKKVVEAQKKEHELVAEFFREKSDKTSQNKQRKLPLLDDDEEEAIHETVKETLVKEPVETPSKPKLFGPKKPTLKIRSPSGPHDDADQHFEEDVWVPPAGQTGDGRTSLNDKLGY